MTERSCQEPDFKMAILTCNLGHVVTFQLAPIAIASLVILAILANILKQAFLRSSNKPPLVFHWLPIIGSTISYGIDPLKFLEDCRKKVRPLLKRTTVPCIY